MQMNDDFKTKLQWALDLAGRGVHILPLHHTEPNGRCSCGDSTCKSPGKHPTVSAWPAIATTDADTIKGWFKRDPAMNYGCMAGAEVFIVDIDTKKADGYSTIENLLDMGRLGIEQITFSVKTPSGGEHLYFTTDRAYSNSASTTLGPGIDTRSGNGYVVGPGSSLFIKDELGDLYEAAYAVAHDAAFSAIPHIIQARLREAKVRADDADTSAHPVLMDSPGAIATAVNWLKSREPAVEKAGGNDQTFATACWLRDFNITEDLALELMLEHFNDKCSPPWDPAELKDIVANAYKYAKNTMGSKSGGLMEFAEAQGLDTEDSILPDGVKTPGKSPATSSDTENLDDPSEPTGQRKRTVFGSITASAFRSRGKVYTFLVPGILPDHGVVMLSGSYGRHKSGLTDDLMFALATDRKWLDHFDVAQGFIVLHRAAEDDIGTEMRLNAWETKYGVKVSDDRYHQLTEFPNITDRHEVDDFIHQWKTRYPGRRFVVAFDTWARLLSGTPQLKDEAIQPILDNLEYLTRTLGGPVIIPAHPPKGAKDGDETQMSVSGLMNVMGSATGVLYLLEGRGSEVKVYVEKTRGGKARYHLGSLVPTLHPTGTGHEVMLLSFTPASSLPPTMIQTIDKDHEAARLAFAVDLDNLTGGAPKTPLEAIKKMVMEGGYWPSTNETMAINGTDAARKMPGRSKLYQMVNNLMLIVDPANPKKKQSRDPIVLPDGERQMFVTIEPSKNVSGVDTMWLNITHRDPAVVAAEREQQRTAADAKEGDDDLRFEDHP